MKLQNIIDINNSKNALTKALNREINIYINHIIDEESCTDIDGSKVIRIPEGYRPMVFIPEESCYCQVFETYRGRNGMVNIMAEPQDLEEYGEESYLVDCSITDISLDDRIKILQALHRDKQ